MRLLNSTRYWQWNITLGLLGFWTLYTFLYLVKNSPPFTRRQEGIHFLKSFAKLRYTMTQTICKGFSYRWNIMEWFECSGMWHCSAGWAVPYTRKDHCASVCSPTQHHIPEEWVLQQHSCENIVSHTACSKIGLWLWVLDIYEDSEGSGW